MSHLFEFGGFVIDIKEETLRRGAERINVNRRTFGVLKLLVEREGNVVSKQEFFDTVWADTFVEDNSLTVAMTTLRRQLGDDARNPKFIENLPRKGYRFIAPVTPIEAVLPQTSYAGNGTVPTPEAPAPAFAVKHWQNKFAVVGVLAVAVLLVSAAYLYIKPSAGRQIALDSIAVMPLTNENPDLAYLSDGLTEGLIQRLGSIGDLRVIASHSVFQYKDRPAADRLAAGRELNVQAVLNAELSAVSKDYVVRAEVVDVRDGSRLWEKKYVRRTYDTHLIEQDIFRDLLEAFRPESAAGQAASVRLETGDSAEAVDLYLKGRHYLNKRRDDDTGKAIEFFRQAIEKDPAYAPPHLGLANCYLWFHFPYPVSMSERARMVETAARNALEIDPKLGEAYATLAINSHFNKWDWPAAEASYRRAVELAPNHATTRHWYAEFLATKGSFDESFEQYRRAIELDPLSLAIRTDLGLSYMYARQFDKAIDELNKVKMMNPGYSRTYTFLTYVYEEAGMPERAAQERVADRQNYGPVEQRWLERFEVLTDSTQKFGIKGYWDAALEIEQEEFRNTWFAVRYHSRFGDRNKAFELLEILFQQRQPMLVWLKVTPEIDGLRQDERLAKLIQRIGIP